MHTYAHNVCSNIQFVLPVVVYLLLTYLCPYIASGSTSCIFCSSLVGITLCCTMLLCTRMYNSFWCALRAVCSGSCNSATTLLISIV